MGRDNKEAIHQSTQPLKSSVGRPVGLSAVRPHFLLYGPLLCQSRIALKCTAV